MGLELYGNKHMRRWRQRRRRWRSIRTSVDFVLGLLPINTVRNAPKYNIRAFVSLSKYAIGKPTIILVNHRRVAA